MSYSETEAALIREIATLREDSKRLDWLDKNPTKVGRSYGYLGSADKWVVRHDNGYFDTALDLRAAIDAAREKEG